MGSNSTAHIGISPSAIDCPSSYLIQAKVNDTILHNSAHALSVTGDRIVFNYIYPPDDLTGAGVICDERPYTWANNGPAQECEDYSVRFCCDKNMTQHDNSTSKFSIRWSQKILAS